MAKKFAPGLDKAWFQYQDLYDRHMTLLRTIGEEIDLNSLKDKFEAQIDYALNKWSTPQNRFEMGGYNDFDLGLNDNDNNDAFYED